MPILMRPLRASPSRNSGLRLGRFFSPPRFHFTLSGGRCLNRELVTAARFGEQAFDRRQRLFLRFVNWCPAPAKE